MRYYHTEFKIDMTILFFIYILCIKKIDLQTGSDPPASRCLQEFQAIFRIFRKFKVFVFCRVFFANRYLFKNIMLHLNRCFQIWTPYLYIDNCCWLLSRYKVKLYYTYINGSSWSKVHKIEEFKTLEPKFRG